jgi:hypothetical protein
MTHNHWFLVASKSTPTSQPASAVGDAVNLRASMEGGGAAMPDSPEIDRYWAGSLDAGLKGLSDQFERERNERVAQFNENRKERKQYNESVRNVMEAHPRPYARYRRRWSKVLGVARRTFEVATRGVEPDVTLPDLEPS